MITEEILYNTESKYLEVVNFIGAVNHKESYLSISSLRFRKNLKLKHCGR